MHCRPLARLFQSWIRLHHRPLPPWPRSNRPLIQLGGLQKQCCKFSQWSQTRFYAFWAWKLHPIVTFLAIFMQCFLVSTNGGFDELWLNPLNPPWLQDCCIWSLFDMQTPYKLDFVLLFDVDIIIITAQCWAVFQGSVWFSNSNKTDYCKSHFSIIPL